MLLSSLAALLLSGSPCGPLDLDTALWLAGQRSDEVAIKQAELASAQVDKSLALALAILPSASATLIVAPSPGAHADGGNILAYQGSNRGLSDIGVFGRVDVQVVQPLWTWGQLSGARDAARDGVAARQYLVQDTLSQIQLRVIQLYWGDALARRLLALADDVDKSLVDVDKEIDKSLAEEDGTVSPQDRYQVALFKADLAGRRAEAERGKELARIGLAATLALDGRDLQLREVDLARTNPAVPSLEAALSQAALSRPDLRALGAGMEAKRAEIRIKEGAMFPQIFVAGQFSYGYAYNRDVVSNPWISDPFNVFTLGAALGVRQDLGFAMLLAQASKARAELSTLERQHAGLQRLIQTQVESGLAELTAARKRSDASTQALSAGRSWFRAATLDFGAGVGDAKALLLAYRGYVESQVSSSQASYDVLVAKARLDQAMAIPLAQGEAHCNSQ